MSKAKFEAYMFELQSSSKRLIQCNKLLQNIIQDTAAAILLGYQNENIEVIISLSHKNIIAAVYFSLNLKV